MVPLIFEERINLVKQYIKPIMDIKIHDIKDNDLVIHLRSGDIIVGGASGVQGTATSIKSFDLVLNVIE